jgi:hypothetical protein
MFKALGKHPVSNASLGVGTVSFCIQQWLQVYFSKGWQKVPWGWIAAVLFAVWIGSQLRQFENGNHWIQAWIAKRKERIVFSPALQFIPRPADHLLTVSVEMGVVRKIKNATVRLDVYTLRTATGQTQWNEPYGALLKIRRTTIFAHKDLNKGDFHHVPILLVENGEQEEPANPWAIFHEGFYRSTVTITSASAEPIHMHFDFFMIRDGGNRQLVRLPFGWPSCDFRGDGLDYQEIPAWPIQTALPALTAS